MANRFRKTPQADVDLDSIWDFIASHSVRSADKQIARIAEIFEMLLGNPLAGRERRDLRIGLRSFPRRQLRHLLCSVTGRRRDCPRHARPAGYQR
ncbi:type II toxin-antitoxin system RelE/ParE family toxin [Bradyrhizobium sp. USDA 4354]